MKIGTTIFTNIQDARDNQHQWKHAKIQSQRRIHEIERRYDELEKRVTGKHESSSTEEAEIPERQHTTTTATQTEEMIGETDQQQHVTTTKAQRAELAGEAEQQHSTKTSVHTEKQRLTPKTESSLPSSRKERIWTERRRPKWKTSARRSKKRIRNNRRSKRHEKVQNILGKFKGITLIVNIKTWKKTILSRTWRKRSRRHRRHRGMALLRHLANILRRSKLTLEHWKKIWEGQRRETWEQLRPYWRWRKYWRRWARQSHPRH